jgi:tetratricopeptide (TPR) repeat protein
MSAMRTYEARQLRLCAWDHILARNAGPVVLDAWFADDSGNVACPPFKWIGNGTIECAAVSALSVRERAERGVATWVAPNRIHPVPEGVLVLVPPDLPHSYVRALIDEVVIELPGPQLTRTIVYASRAEVNKLLYQLACDYYDDACHRAARGEIAASADAVTRAILANPEFPQPYVLSASLRQLVAPDDNLFPKTMVNFAAAAQAAGVAYERPGWFRPSESTDFERVLVSLFHVEVTGRRTDSTGLEARTMSGIAHLGRDLRMLVWPPRLLDRLLRNWQMVARQCRRAGNYDAAQKANDLGLCLAEMLAEARPEEPTNQFRFASLLEAAGKFTRAAAIAERAVGMEPVADQMSEPAYMSNWKSGCADAWRILGRARFLGEVDGSPVDAMAQAAGRFRILLEEGSGRSEVFLKDRLAQSLLYLGIAERDENRSHAAVQDAVRLYLELIDSSPTPSTYLHLCDAFIFLGELSQAETMLREYYRLRAYDRPFRKRQHIILRRMQLLRRGGTYDRQAVVSDVRQTARDHRCAVDAA